MGEQGLCWLGKDLGFPSEGQGDPFLKHIHPDLDQ